jgi:hypothetical protein
LAFKLANDNRPYLAVKVARVCRPRLLGGDQGADGKSGGDQGVIFFNQVFRVCPGAIGALRSL